MRLLQVLLACGFEAPPAEPEVLVPLDAPRLLRRMSLDLRGALPTVEELDAVEVDPAALDAIRERYLHDPAFEERLVQVLQERWQTRLDEFRVTAIEYGYPQTATYDFHRSIGEEPLRLMARIAAEDRPWTEIVTTDTSMANPILAEIWPVERAPGEGWQPATYTDLRPTAGVLTSNGLWWRYISPIFNLNRARAAAIVDLLTCEDLLERPIELSRSASALAGDAATAVTSDPSCLACHATIEPIASLLFGFSAVDDQSALEMERYHPEREHMGSAVTGVEGAWFGQPVDGLEALGRAIAQDPRFIDCAVRSTAEGLLRRPIDASDGAMLAAARERFVDGDLALREVFRAVTDDARYRAGGLGPDADEDHERRETTRRILVTAQLRSLTADLGAGWAWRQGGADLLDDDLKGYRVLGGSVDGTQLTAPQPTPGLSWALLTERTAEAFARGIVAHDLDAATDDRWLLQRADRSSVPGSANFRYALEALHWHLLARRASGEDITAMATLWTQARAASGSVDEAWATVLGALLRDPDFVGY